MSPAKLTRCVRHVEKTVKPRKRQTKKQAAFGICVKSTGQKAHHKRKKRGK